MWAAALASSLPASSLEGMMEGLDHFRVVPRLGEHGILTSDLLLMTFISHCLDITSKDGIGPT